ncbi:DNA-binding protein [bacterium]|nr:DNA-binding protein [bacterium]
MEFIYFVQNQLIPDKLLTSEQVSKILQVHPFTVLKYLKAGKLKGIKLGRVWRIRESNVERFLEERSMVSNESVQTFIEKEKPIMPDNQSDHYILE